MKITKDKNYTEKKKKKKKNLTWTIPLCKQDLKDFPKISYCLKFCQDHIFEG